MTIYEVGPRDGLQNEKAIVPAEVKAEFVRPPRRGRPADRRGHQLRAPEWVPQLADAAEADD